MIDKRHLVKLTQQLIRIPSENPPGNEAGIACFVKQFMQGLGLKPKIYEFKRKRSNVVVSLKAKGAGKSLLVSPHLDTVPAGENWRGFFPFAASLHSGRIYGRGASDDKGNLAVLMEVIKSLIQQRHILSYNLVFAATADEETGSHLGLIPLLDKGILNPDAALILDADGFNIVLVQKGLIHLKIKIRGKSAHGAYPWQGVNAIELGMEIFSRLKAHKFIYRKSPYLHSPTINIGKISGGDKVNIVADWCEFELDIRFLPGMSAPKIIQQIRGIIKDCVEGFSRRSGITLGKGDIEIMAMQNPARIRQGHYLVRHLRKAMVANRITPKLVGSEGATVITFLQNRNIPALATGFSSPGCAHSSNEYVKINDLYKGAKVLEEFLKGFRFP